MGRARSKSAGDVVCLFLWASAQKFDVLAIAKYSFKFDNLKMSDDGCKYVFLSDT